MYYDPLGRVVKTINADNSEQRVVYGVPAALGASDAPGHFDSSLNILNSGNVRANAGAMDLDDKKNNNKILSIEKLPALLQGIIESWQQKKSTFTFVPLSPFQKK
ncbi:MAG: hypothetical protein Q8T03_02720 [Bacteroidota bacterium]|nr:hypothetical protein [Bacteroidota bacterium]